MSEMISGVPSEYEVWSVAEALQRFPQFEFDTDDWDAEDLESVEVIYLKGNHCLDEHWDRALDHAYWGRRYLLVDGDLHLEDDTHFHYWVTGDVHGDVLHLYDGIQCLGTMHARQFAYLYAEDDTRMCNEPVVRLATPYLFSWFYGVDELTLTEDTLVFLLADWDYSHSSDLPGTVIPWHEARFVLRDELQSQVAKDWDDRALWDLGKIGAALARGESILRDGVTLASLRPDEQAGQAVQMQDWRLAWCYYRATSEAAPGSFLALYHMGNCYANVGAYAQGLSCMERAAACYPKVQPNLLNEAAFSAAVWACWLDQPEHALEILAQHMPYNRHYKLLRARAEALLMMGRLDEALQDLDGVLQQDKHYGPALWLRGKVAWLQGLQDEATLWQDQAATRDARLKADFATHGNTAFWGLPPVHVDWDDLDLNSLKPRQDQAWWLALLKTAPTEMSNVPAELRTQSFLQALLQQQPEQIAGLLSAFPADAFTPELALTLVRVDGQCLQGIPPALHGLDLYRQAHILQQSRFPLSSVPEALLDAEVCQLAIDKGARLDQVPLAWRSAALCQYAVERGGSLEAVPEVLRSQALCELAVRRSGGQIQFVPPALQTEAMWILALAHSTCWQIRNTIPASCLTLVHRQQALRLNKGLLQQLLGYLVDAETYAYAVSLYGQDEDWDALVAPHRLEACQADQCHFVEQCWLVFWDEATVLRRIRLDGHAAKQLHPYDIPASHFTPAIAEACFASEPVHLKAIPTALITLAMSESFIQRYPRLLQDVPFAHRTVGVCLLALQRDLAQQHLVPAPVLAEVAAQLLAHPPKAAEEDALLLLQGQGLLMQQPPQTAAAIESLTRLCPEAWLAQEVVLTADDTESAPLTVEEAQRRHACYLLGYAWHQQGDPVRAEVLRARSGMVVEYGSFNPAQGQAQGDFNQAAFDQYMQQFDQCIQDASRLPHAWQLLLQARALLEESANTSPYLWAHLLERQRWVTHEQKDWARNTAVCEETVERLQSCSLWAYHPQHDVIRAALREALHRLGCIPLDDLEAPTVAEVRVAVEQVWRALRLLGPAEAPHAVWHFYDIQLCNLAWLSAQDGQWERPLQRLRQRVAALDWSSFLYSQDAVNIMQSAIAD